MERHNAVFGSLETYNFGTDERVMVFEPTMEEFADFEKYMAYMEEKGAHKAGIAKVIPPRGWCPKTGGYSGLENLKITSPVEQLLVGSSGAYTLCNVEKKELTLDQYFKLATSKQFDCPTVTSFDDVERSYWKNLHCFHPLYGADVPGSLYDKSQKVWNIATLPSILKWIFEDYGIQIQGVNTPYLYFGMWKTTFPWHTEDADLYSINYLHFGAPKFWYVVPPEHGLRLERVAQGYFQSLYKQCHAFLRHKTTVLSPTLLHNYSIPYNKVLQFPGEFIVTFPYAYHSGFNTGFNCAESTNFALPRWVDYGKYCSICECMPDSVKIDMDCFVKRYQPEKYEAWRSGTEKSAHPEGAAAGQSHARTNSNSSLPPPLSEASSPKTVKTIRSRRQGKPRGRPPTRPRADSLPEQDSSSSSKKRRPAADDPCQDSSHKISYPRSDSPDDEDRGCKRTVFPLSPVSAAYSSSQTNGKATEPDSKSTSLPTSSNSLTSLSCDTVGKSQPASRRLVVHHAMQSTVDDFANGSKVVAPVLSICTDDSVPQSKLLTSGNFDSPPRSTIPTIRILLNSAVTANRQLSFSDSEQVKLLPKIGCSCGRCTSCPVKSLSEALLSDWRSEDVANLGPLAAALSPLWIWHPFNFDAERSFNHFMSTRAPHCAVCQLFVADGPGLHGPVPPRSTPLIPELAYALKTKTRLRHITNLPTESMLLHCSTCSLTVHAFCYGATEPQSTCESPPSWRCDRCTSGASDAHCSLCVMRGGALKATATGKWAHIICALCSEGCFFESDLNRSPILEPAVPAQADIPTSIEKHQQVLNRCRVCQRSDGAFTRCTVGCRLSSHATCSAYSGVLMVIDGWPNPIAVVCHVRHTSRRNAILMASSLCADVGDPILLISSATSNSEGKRSPAASGLHERLIPGVVTSRSEKVRLEVRFEETATTCDDIDPADVVDPPFNGVLPEPKSWITIRWVSDTETTIVKALCRGIIRQYSLDVQLKDGTFLKNVSPGQLVPFFLKNYDPLYFSKAR